MDNAQTRAALAAELTREAERHRAKHPQSWPAHTFGSFCLQLSLALAAAQTADELERLADAVRRALTANR